MASYRPFPPQPSYPPQPQPPSQNPLPPPPPPPYSSYPPPPPPPDSSFPPPPPPPPYYQQHIPPPHYPQFQQQHSFEPPPPPPPSSPPPPPPPASPPPPPPPSAPPPPPPPDDKNKRSNEPRQQQMSESARRELGAHSGSKHHHHKPPAAAPPPQVKRPNGPPGRVETEEERRMRKKRDFEKQRQQEKLRQQQQQHMTMKLNKTSLIPSSSNGKAQQQPGSEPRTMPLLTGDRVENRLKKPTTFLCKLKFRNELPDPSAQLKLMAAKRDKDQYTKYTITSLEKLWKPKIFLEPDLGIPLDLLDLSVYNPPKVKPPLAPEDEELLRDDDTVTPVKKDGIRRKERPTDKGVSWLVKTQYISSISMESSRQSLTEKQVKEMREIKGGRNILENLNNRERQIKEIEASFEACKSRPVHALNKSLQPVEVLPLLPDFERYDEQFVVATFDGAPTADSEIYGKLNQSVRDVHESRAVLKSYAVAGLDPANPEKFLAYMVPSLNELSKDMYDENEDISYSWVREYHWDVGGDDADDPTSYLVTFDDGVARYLPLPTKLNLRKRRAREGRSSDEVEHFPIPSRVTVRQGSTVSVIEHKNSGDYSNSRGGLSSSKTRRLDVEDDGGGTWRHEQQQDADQYNEAEDDFSE